MQAEARKPRICFVAPSFVLETDFRFAHKQCPGLAKHGFEVSYFVQSDLDEFQGVRILGLNHEKSKFKKILAPWKLLGRLLRQPCEAYHFGTVEMLPVALVLKLLSRRRVVFDSHEDFVEFVRLKPYIKGVSEWILVQVARVLVWLACKSLDAVIFGDEGVEESYPPIPSDRRLLFHHFPLLSAFGPSPIAFADRKYDMVYTGPLSKWKGAFEMLECIRLLRDRCGSIRVLFVGEPVEYIKKDFYEFIREKNLEDSVEITGRVPYARVPELLDQCKVGLIALHDMEKFRRQSCTKLFEYMAKRIPCVSVDLPPERRFMVDGEHGLFVPPQDPEAMAEAVWKIISDPQLGDAMGERARGHLVERGYYAEKEMEDLVRFYEYILAQPRRSLFRRT